MEYKQFPKRSDFIAKARLSRKIPVKLFIEIDLNIIGLFSQKSLGDDKSQLL